MRGCPARGGGFVASCASCKRAQFVPPKEETAAPGKARRHGAGSRQSGKRWGEMARRGGKLRRAPS